MDDYNWLIGAYERFSCMYMYNYDMTIYEFVSYYIYITASDCTWLHEIKYGIEDAIFINVQLGLVKVNLSLILVSCFEHIVTHASIRMSITENLRRYSETLL